MASYPPLRDTDEGYEQPIDKNTEGLLAKGFYPQGAATNDETVGIERDVSGNLILKDGPAGTKTLSSISPAGGLTSNYDFLLDCDPDNVDITYVITRSSGLVTQELWKKTSDNKTIKTIDYTRVSGLLDTEVVKVYGTDGTTVVAQKTVTYTRSSGVVTGATVTRDV